MVIERKRASLLLACITLLAGCAGMSPQDRIGALMKEGQQQFREALEAFVKGLAATGGPERAELIRGLLDGGVEALARGGFRGAAGLLREYLKFDSGNLSAYLNLAKAYRGAGELSSAIEAFRKVLELNPRHEEALRFLLTR